MKRDNSYLIGNQFAKGHTPSNAFPEGHTPWNKGKKGIHLSPKSEFKKGQKPKNKMKIGTTTVRTDKSGNKRRWIKVYEPNVWIEYAKFVWIHKYGAIPMGLLTHHLDKNTLNDNIENISLVTRSAHINLHRAELNHSKEQKQGQGALFS